MYNLAILQWILTKNMIWTSSIRVELDDHNFQTVFVLFLFTQETLAPIQVHCLEFFPSMKTQERLCMLENVGRTSTDIGVSSKWVKFYFKVNYSYNCASTDHIQCSLEILWEILCKDDVSKNSRHLPICVIILFLNRKGTPQGGVKHFSLHFWVLKCAISITLLSQCDAPKCT